MKFRFIFSLLMGAGALGALAQGGYQDGIDYFNADRFQDAQEILNRTLNDANTDKALSYYYLGAIDLRENHLDKAKANFDRGIEANPQCGYNYIGLGQLALKSGDKKTAENYFKQGLATDKKSPKLMTAVARAYYSVDPVAYKKNIDEYIAKAMKQSKNLEPDVYVLQGDMVTNDPGEAAGKYEQAIMYEEEKGTVNPEAYVKYANVYLQTNPDFAIQKLVELNSKLPTSALAQRELAEKYYESNQFKKAAEQYGKYMKNPNHFQRDEQRYSLLLYSDEKYPESLAIVNQVLAKDPTNHYMYRMSLLNNAAMQQWDDAIAAAKKLFATPDATFTYTDYITYGDALAAKKDTIDALNQYEKAFEMRPDQTQILAKISGVYNTKKDFKKAAEYQQKYIDATPDASIVEVYTLGNRYRNLAISLPEGSADRSAAAEKGIVYVDKAIGMAADESKGTMYRTLATLQQLRDGKISPDVAQSYELMLKYYDMNPANLEKQKAAYNAAYQNLGQYYLDNGDRATARGYYEKFAALNPDNVELQKYIKNF